jgi:1,4-dihydroxy-6-naphthoate synthase
LTFREAGLQLVADVGAWWGGRTGLPLPLGVNAVRRDLEEELGAGTLAEIGGVLRRSVEYALAHRHEAVGHAMRYARGMDRPLTDEFVRMYVNRWTLEFGEVGRRAVQLFLDEAHAAGLSPPPGVVEFVEAGRAD